MSDIAGDNTITLSINLPSKNNTNGTTATPSNNSGAKTQTQGLRGGGGGKLTTTVTDKEATQVGGSQREDQPVDPGFDRNMEELSGDDIVAEDRNQKETREGNPSNSQESGYYHEQAKQPRPIPKPVRTGSQYPPERVRGRNQINQPAARNNKETDNRESGGDFTEQQEQQQSTTITTPDPNSNPTNVRRGRDGGDSSSGWPWGLLSLIGVGVVIMLTGGNNNNTINNVPTNKFHILTRPQWRH